MPLITATSTRGRTLSPVCVKGHLAQVSGDCPRWAVGLLRGGSDFFGSEGIGERRTPRSGARCQQSATRSALPPRFARCHTSDLKARSFSAATRVRCVMGEPRRGPLALRRPGRPTGSLTRGGARIYG